jgi:uncharacterized membrane protein (DUF2068 family)
MINQRPAGVTILAVLQLLAGILNLLFGIASLFFGGAIVFSKAAEQTGAAIDMGPIMVTIGALTIAIGVFSLILSYGLFNLKPWAWNLAIILAIINFVTHFASIFQGGNVPGAIIVMVISGLILYYLFHANVQRAFGMV